MRVTMVSEARSIPHSMACERLLATTYPRAPSTVRAAPREGRPTSGRASTCFCPRSTIATCRSPVVTTASRAEAAGASASSTAQAAAADRAMRKILTAFNVAPGLREGVSTMGAMRAPGLTRALMGLFAVLASATATAGCGDDSKGAPTNVPDTMRLTSPAFKEGGTIPTKFPCDGALKGVSPPLAWSRRPRDTKSQALIVTDPDAPGGTFVHWTVWGMMDRTSGLETDIPPLGLPQGKNSAGTSKYAPPCPPKGASPHRYEFAIYALKEPVKAKPGAASDEVIDDIQKAALARGVLTGRYGR